MWWNFWSGIQNPRKTPDRDISEASFIQPQPRGLSVNRLCVFTGSQCIFIINMLFLTSHKSLICTGEKQKTDFFAFRNSSPDRLSSHSTGFSLTQVITHSRCFSGRHLGNKPRLSVKCPLLFSCLHNMRPAAKLFLEPLGASGSLQLRVSYYTKKGYFKFCLNISTEHIYIPS